MDAKYGVFADQPLIFLYHLLFLTIYDVPTDQQTNDIYFFYLAILPLYGVPTDKQTTYDLNNFTLACNKLCFYGPTDQWLFLYRTDIERYAEDGKRQAGKVNKRSYAHS